MTTSTDIIVEQCLLDDSKSPYQNHHGWQLRPTKINHFTGKNLKPQYSQLRKSRPLVELLEMTEVQNSTNLQIQSLSRISHDSSDISVLKVSALLSGGSPHGTYQHERHAKSTDRSISGNSKYVVTQKDQNKSKYMQN